MGYKWVAKQRTAHCSFIFSKPIILEELNPFTRRTKHLKVVFKE